MDAWWPLLVRAEFEPTLGEEPLSKTPGHAARRRDHARGDAQRARLLRRVVGLRLARTCATSTARRPRGAWSRGYCGGGSKSKCRAALRSSLRKALGDPAGRLGHGDCAGDPDPQCYDQNRSIITSAISIPPAPFQNRPTFQQTVSVTKNLP